MRWFHCSNTKGRSIADVLKDNQLFIDAYNAAKRDKELAAETEQLEKKYVRQHLIEMVGEDEADRILSERGY